MPERTRCSGPAAPGPLGPVLVPDVSVEQGRWPGFVEAALAAGADRFLSKPFSPRRLLETVTTLAELDSIVAANPKVLVDVTAEWCIECRIMDKNLFHNRPAQMQDWQLVRLDITETTADSKAILARYKLFGPPALLYYQDGQLVNQQVGEIGRAAFEQTLTALN